MLYAAHAMQTQKITDVQTQDSPLVLHDGKTEPTLFALSCYHYTDFI